MRDVRYGPKSRVTLEQGQLIGLAFFAILSGGLMFALGYAAGKNRRPALPIEPSALSRIDQNHDRARDMKSDSVDLTFYHTLMEKEERPKVNDLVASDIKPADSKAADSKPADSKLGQLKSAEPKVVEPKWNEPRGAEDTLAAVVKDSAAKAALAKEDEPAPAKRVALTPTSMAAAPAPTPMTSGDFTIQVSAFRSEDEARAYAHRLQAKGFSSNIVPAVLLGKGTWYRVRVGRFESDVAARLYKQKLDREGFPAWVVRAE